MDPLKTIDELTKNISTKELKEFAKEIRKSIPAFLKIVNVPESELKNIFNKKLPYEEGSEEKEKSLISFSEKIHKKMFNDDFIHPAPLGSITIINGESVVDFPFSNLHNSKNRLREKIRIQAFRPNTETRRTKRRKRVLPIQDIVETLEHIANKSDKIAIEEFKEIIIEFVNGPIKRKQKKQKIRSLVIAMSHNESIKSFVEKEKLKLEFLDVVNGKIEIKSEYL